MTRFLLLPAQVEGRHLPLLRHRLLAELRHDPVLVVACRDVEALSPAGQALLLSVRRAARRRGGALHLQEPSPACRDALRSTGLAHLLRPALSPVGAGP